MKKVVDAAFIAARTVKEGDCLIYTGRIRSDGYPVHGTTAIHRRVYELTKGEIPKGRNVHHTCEHKKCVNADHLVAITTSIHARLHHDKFLPELRVLQTLGTP